MSKKIVFIMTVICSFLLFSSFQMDDTMTIKKKIDWGDGVLHLEVTRKLRLPGEYAPDKKYLVEREIRDKLPDIFLQSILDINVDSAQTIDDIIRGKAEEIRLIKGIGLHIKNEGAYQSTDLKTIHIHYSFQLFSDKGLVPLFVKHEYPRSLDKELGFIPATDYTGLVVYARGTYPLYGTSRQVPAEPALFPVLYDEETDVVLEKQMCHPDYLIKWGMAAYTDSYDETPFLKRIGISPLRVMARQVFGRHHSDIILPREAVRKLLSSEHNRNMLKEGRILVIINPADERMAAGNR
jgi:hypothetical protein